MDDGMLLLGCEPNELTSRATRNPPPLALNQACVA